MKNLHNDPYWHTLLHFIDGESEIDDPNFFLSTNGKKDPKSELEATIKYIKKGEIDCRYPARIQWLKTKMELGEHSCKEFDDLIAKYNPNFIYIIFPTAHINSPASMYGHTFLRIDKDEHTLLISNALNDAAQTDESNGLLYAFYGLMGGYKGLYSVSAYYDKIKEYNDMERRDIWEYKLKLTKKEIKRLLMHQRELEGIKSDYFFFTQNCSYNLLWLLEVAKPKLKLTDDFKYKVIPIDTLRAIRAKSLLGKSKFRPSKTKKMKKILEKIKNTQFNSKEQKVAKLDFEIEALRLNRVKNRVEKKEYISKFLQLLNRRSKYKIKNDYKIDKPIDPLLGHKTTRLVLGIDEASHIKLEFKPSFHDKYDLDKGFSNGAYINFFNLEIAENNLYKFDFLDIASYAPRDDYFKPLSWSVKLGFERDYKGDLNFRLRGGVGHSYNFGGFLTYTLIHPVVYIKDRVMASLAPKVGVLKNYKNLKFGISTSREFFTSGDAVSFTEIFLTYQFKKDFALNLKYDITDVKKRGSVSLFYYF
jgi:hypothetical protein